MSFPSKAWRILLLVVCIPIANAAPLQSAGCDEVVTTRFPAANLAISAWESANSALLPDAARESVLKEFCLAAAKMISDPIKPVASSSIDAATPKTLEDYLDRVSKSTKEARSIDATLRQHLGFGGLSRGKPNRFTRLAITYRQTVDALTVNSERLPPSALFLVLVGDLTVDGFFGGKKVCHHEGTATAGVKVEVEC